MNYLVIDEQLYEDLKGKLREVVTLMDYVFVRDKQLANSYLVVKDRSGKFHSNTMRYQHDIEQTIGILLNPKQQLD